MVAVIRLRVRACDGCNIACIGSFSIICISGASFASFGWLPCFHLTGFFFRIGKGRGREKRGGGVSERLAGEIDGQEGK